MEPKYGYVAIEGKASTYEEAICLCGEAFQKANFTEEQFTLDCLEREKEYPTGLYAEIPVAIPHCKSDAIKKDGICYLRLEEPVIFRRLDDDEESVRVRNIFNIALRGDDIHLDFLNKLMKIICDLKIIRQFENEKIENLPALLEKYLGNGE